VEDAMGQQKLVSIHAVFGNIHAYQCTTNHYTTEYNDSMEITEP